ncbi:MAG TPA: SDR family oxidoreductase [Burkholderiaceae bacterium]|nr:SDR family oxidoreductase [Burkholderiaceae bacterium]
MDLQYLTRTFGVTGRTALVTGSSTGIGLAIAEALGRSGARVIVNARHGDRCADAAARLRAQGIEALSVPFDVTDAQAVSEAFGRLGSDEVGVDLLVSNAGVQDRQPVVDMSPESWQSLQDVHVKGAFHCVRAALPGMVTRSFGRIVLMSSVAARAAVPNICGYATAKGALAAFARALAVEYGERGITVNALAPGFVRTEFTAALQANADFAEFLGRSVPLHRWGTVEEIAPAVVFLCSAAGAFVTGHSLTIDGGLLAHL